MDRDKPEKKRFRGYTASRYGPSREVSFGSEEFEGYPYPYDNGTYSVDPVELSEIIGGTNKVPEHRDKDNQDGQDIDYFREESTEESNVSTQDEGSVYTTRFTMTSELETVQWKGNEVQTTSSIPVEKQVVKVPKQRRFKRTRTIIRCLCMCCPCI